MRRVLLFGVPALVAVFLGLLGAIWWATRPDGASPGPPPLAPSLPPATLPEGGIDFSRAPVVGGFQQLPPPVVVQDPPPPPPPEGSWEAVDILVSRRGPVQLDLDALRPKLAECFSASVASGGGPITTVKDVAPMQNEWTTTLLLNVEVSHDQAFIVDAPLESRGKATDGTIACAQAVLRAKSAPGAGLPAGRHRIRFLLTP